MNPSLTMQNQAVNQMKVTTGTPRKVYGARDRITRESHSLVIETTAGDTVKGKPDALWVTDLRRGRLNLYGGMLRYIDHLARRRVPIETALLIPRLLEAYIRELWSDTPSHAAIEVDRAA